MARTTIRCAIYTRKSSEDGLEQDFNSLAAQREACAAYIASQKHEGWTLVPDSFDDGGISGGTLKRPALQRLLAGIDAGRIGMVVVYKIDRLTRSLADFSRMVERLDARGCSFAAVTQSFDTSTSMGRLTLNVLLSFAQFEREVTGERIRDKIAASKRRGMWMGGIIPFGYATHPDRQRRELVIAGDEAEVVRELFHLYEQKGCLRGLADAANARGLRSRRRVLADGRITGGTPFTRGQLHYLLTNPVYLGRIRHRHEIHHGLHPAIVATDLWERVQQKLIAASARPRRSSAAAGASSNLRPGNTSEPAAALLLGRMRDETGDRLTPTHTRNGTRIYRYYVSHRTLQPAANGTPDGWRLPAAALEAAVLDAVLSHLEDAARRGAVLKDPRADELERVSSALLAFASDLRDPAAASLRDVLESGTVAPGCLSLLVSNSCLAEALGVEASRLAEELLAIKRPFAIRRRGVELKIVAGIRGSRPDPILVAALARAHRWAQLIRSGTPLLKIAQAHNTSEAFVRTRARLAFLSPAIQRSILRGDQPAGLSLERLVRTDIPLDWNEQKSRFGFRS